MSKLIRVGALSSVPKGEGRNFDVGSTKIALFHGRDGRAYATQAECPHKKGPLADGLLGGTTLVCPLHDWSFDLVSGMALHGACGIRVYPVRVDAEGNVSVEMDDDGRPPEWRVSDYERFESKG